MCLGVCSFVYHTIHRWIDPKITNKNILLSPFSYHNRLTPTLPTPPYPSNLPILPSYLPLPDNRLVFAKEAEQEPPVKAVVFSQWTFMLDLIEKALKGRGWG